MFYYNEKPDAGDIINKEKILIKKDDYVNELFKFMKRGGDRNVAFIDRLLFAAMIEARSCERFRVLSLNINQMIEEKYIEQLNILVAKVLNTLLTLKTLRPSKKRPASSY